ncbi:uncharacterized protein LOC119002053 [Sturnira hondurensis]|uniref:uncharacterized protein LOC119002053 n=1 Tax=Sturnira hondurensis TaxID=192404 RepID=UPI00187A34A4|nr:uncharacterized protein LOC119002053 [Sturnira hondurensis]
MEHSPVDILTLVLQDSKRTQLNETIPEFLPYRTTSVLIVNNLPNHLLTLDLTGKLNTGSRAKSQDSRLRTLVKSRPGKTGGKSLGKSEPAGGKLSAGCRWRMRIEEPKPARRRRHCRILPPEPTWRQGLVQPQGPSHWESLVQASGHSSPSPARVWAGGGGSAEAVSGGGATRKALCLTIDPQVTETAGFFLLILVRVITGTQLKIVSYKTPARRQI